MGATEELARFINRTVFEDMPEKAISKAKELFLDTVGVALAGTLEASGRIAIEYAKEIGGIPEASILGGGFRTSAPMAAFANALLAQNTDFGDYVPTGAKLASNAGHASCMMVAVALALGEKLGASGAAVLEAYVSGIEVYSKIAAGCPNVQAGGWRNMSIYGIMGATATAAKLLDLDVHQTTMAFGVAASAASGLARPSGKSMTNPLHAGNAARSGVEAALLARKGFTSSSAVIESSLGFCEAFLGKGAADYEKMTRNLGKPYHIISPGLGVKPYPCAFPVHYAAEAVLELQNQYAIAYQDVQSVEVWVSPWQRQTFGIPKPMSGYEAKFSLTFVCATALLDGRLVRSTFTDDNVQDARVKEAMGKVKLMVDESRATERGISRRFFAPVVIKLKDGREYRKRVDAPRGHPRNPISHGDVVAKYQEIAGLVLSPEQVAKSIALLENLERVSNLQELTGILRQGRAG